MSNRTPTVEGELSVANFIDNFFKGLWGKHVAYMALYIEVP